MTGPLRLALRAALAAHLALAGCGDDMQPAATPDAAAPLPDAATSNPDAASPDAPAVTPRTCSDLEETANLSGATPLGALSYRHAWPGYWGAKCNAALVHFTGESSVDADRLGVQSEAPDELWFWLAPGNADYVGTHEDVPFNLIANGQLLETRGSVQIDHFDNPLYGQEPMPTLAGSLRVLDAANGWDVTGTFQATYCRPLVTACP